MSFRFVPRSAPSGDPDSSDADCQPGHQRRQHPTHPHHEHRAGPPRQHPAGAQPRVRTGSRRSAPCPAARGALTVSVGSHQVRLGPVAFWTVVGTLMIMAGWSVVTATYFAFQDDVLGRMVARQADMQFAYEDRLAEMRARVDRATSRQLLDQEQLEAKLDQIVRRQTILEQRATALGTLTDPAATGSVRAPRAGAPAGAGVPKASPMSGPALLAPPSMRDARFDPNASGMRTAGARGGSVQAVLARLSESLDRVEGHQTNVLAAMEDGFESRARRMRAILSEAGLDPAKTVPPGGTGGPYVPYRLAANAGAFERQVYRVTLARVQVDRLAATVVAVPLRKPVDGEIENATSSGFGVRIDPFVGRPAMHTGIDFRGDTGEGIRVTAAGTVVSAGWSGGYGRMVEVDHGNGLSTRYGHLSDIDVHVGQALKAGQVVGRMGSSGRSTGPHLHYETRVDGEAVNPHRFLNAGAKFGLI